jgi:hypothetical protein
MTNKQMFIELTGNGVPKGELKEAMFAFHNKWYGKSPYILKVESPNTQCGSCIQRVKSSCWKVYHSDLYRWSYDEVEWTGRLGMHNAPAYKLTKKQLDKRIVRRK